ncbi:phosphatidylserine decarboxylase [Legionella lytica]|uniref:Phosphatidylserine decarboxylase proenzyme n=1 Tax=Legionella lytica TaxID=96232 RepID=A0ABY4Y995_9GAMM|nr:archaetidylserine decarboxylase [Legionella lytica]USQ13664.1 phosphatidylserine decarboxylase [Legionella lytica]
MSLDLLKTFPQYVIPKHGLTTLAGCLAEVNVPRVKNFIIQRFIKKYNVNMSEALIEDPTAYANFNEFFIRHLKPECRPLAAADIISPVDGCISEIGAIHQGQLIQAKGREYSVTELLACSDEEAQQFESGRFATLYLSPKDYHRIHLPLDAELLSMTYVPGALFSVQPTTARVVPKLFARNERLVISFATAAGPMKMVLVGATIVGAIGTSWHGDVVRSKQITSFDYRQDSTMTKHMSKGCEVGYFKLGSTVILLFADGNKVQWDGDLKAESAIRFGQAMGRIS